jgi:hypothetical protein
VVGEEVHLLSQIISKDQIIGSNHFHSFAVSGRAGEGEYPWAIAFDEPLGGVGVGCFEHGLLEPEAADDLRDNVCPQRVGVLANIVGVDHDHICTCLQASLGPPNQQINIFDSFCTRTAQNASKCCKYYFSEVECVVNKGVQCSYLMKGSK